MSISYFLIFYLLFININCFSDDFLDGDESALFKIVFWGEKKSPIESYTEKLIEEFFMTKFPKTLWRLEPTVEYKKNISPMKYLLEYTFTCKKSHKIFHVNINPNN